MKLCIAGSFGNEDIGDDAMLECHLANLDGIGFPREDATLVGHKVRYTQSYFQHTGRVMSSKRPRVLHSSTDSTNG